MKQLACITGASRGIGYKTALTFAEAGYDLLLICKHNIDEMKKIVNHPACQNIECHFLQLDVGNATEVENVLGRYLHTHQLTPDILIHNAGISHIGLLQDMSVEQWQQIIDTNLSSAFYLSKKMIPAFLKQGHGKIINVSSVWGNAGASCEVAYSASKGGLNSFTRALAKELAPSNIQVNAVAFGAIETTMNAHLSKEEHQALCDEIPIGRYGTTKECADLLLQVAHSPEYLTGQIITMDGGWI